MFETQIEFGNKICSGKIGLIIRTHASPKVGEDKVSGLRKIIIKRPLLVCRSRCKWSMETNRMQLGKKSNSVIRPSSVTRSKIGEMPDQ